MRLFNAFQLLVMFAATPFAIHWLATTDFAYSAAAFYVALVAYITSFAWMTVTVADALTD